MVGGELTDAVSPPRVFFLTQRCISCAPHGRIASFIKDILYHRSLVKKPLPLTLKHGTAKKWASPRKDGQ